jgi:cyclopropane-fatty-acyl-phospholipid synthase
MMRSVDRWARKAVHQRLLRLRQGHLTLVEKGEASSFGDPTSPRHALVNVESPAFYRAIVARGALGGAEAYMEGHWTTDDLTAVIRLLAADRDLHGALGRGLAWLSRPVLAAYHALRRNSRTGSRRNIAEHYDLSNEFFALFLDSTMTYSSGIYERPDSTLEEASIAKYERLCRKLDLGPDDHVLEIGTGWGGFAIYAASRYGCRITTTTISRQQYELARERIEARGLADRVQVICEDYRDLRGRYDKLVSIEMVEAVGLENLGRFFEVCSERLEDDGRMAIQAITLGERDIPAHHRSVDFIKRYIFPGSELVSVGTLNEAASLADLRMSHLEELTPHYSRTLRDWRERLFEHLGELRDLGFDEAFQRRFEYYFAYCEGGFDERQIGVVQAVLEKPESRAEVALGRL